MGGRPASQGRLPDAPDDLPGGSAHRRDPRGGKAQRRATLVLATLLLLSLSVAAGVGVGLLICKVVGI